MSTPNQPGGDKPSAGSAGSAASEQHTTRTPENGSARSNPTSGSTPGQAPAGRGPGPAAGPAARPGAAPPQHQGPRTQAPHTQASQGRPLPPQQGRPAEGAPGRQGPPQQAPADRAAGNQAPARSQPPGNPAPGSTAPADPAGNRAPASGAPVDGAQPVRGSQAPPWQRGMQREPQTNLKRPLQGQPGQPGSQQRPRPDSPSSATAGAGTAAAAAGAPSAPGAQKPSTAAPTTPPGAPTQAVPVQKGPPAAPKQPAPAQGRPSSAAAAAAGGVTGTAAAAAVSQRESAKAKASAIDGPTRHINRDVLPKDMPDLSEAKHPLPASAATGQQPKVAAAPQRVGEGEALRATVQIRKVDPWSTLKISSVISVSLFFVWMVAVGLLYVVLDGMGVWDRLNNAFTDIVAESSSEGLVTAGQVFGYAAVIGLANMVLFTALATIGAFIYNLCSDLVGGVEVTLADRD
ncbi:DUF3566 domain-containing protein [Rhodococcus sp. USK13]|uniref:DUF3566 domain-containing protein n=1 Tax=Rhodococcus sp. USK13 TaxID=2806442 RepID=UPI001BCE5E62|nr:DUF3566 domain-containing protein [Rhodococcus sp. USK13]